MVFLFSHCSLLPALPSSKAELLITTAHPIPYTYLLPVLGCAPDTTPTPRGASLCFLAPHNLDNCYSSSRPQFRPTFFGAPSLARHVGWVPGPNPWMTFQHHTFHITLYLLCMCLFPSLDWARGYVLLIFLYGSPPSDPVQSVLLDRKMNDLVRPFPALRLFLFLVS